ncbi:hypothetical protein MPL3365_140104 [Mesorhizobium plurifarium]|uniref:HTH cro/C1-type domain-containing protein n=1 Tax=Mesorhizobium plurifarium TaxID=69974 RepID=A0A090G485_MESPL|nr:hypothetical protein MPL3365_140104 [Mesorhizobium plurifarium]
MHMLLGGLPGKPFSFCDVSEHFSLAEFHLRMTEPHETGEAEDANRRELTPAYCRAARALLDWPQVRLAAKSNLSEATIRDFESGRRILRTGRIVAVRKAFESAGVTLTLGGPLLTTSADIPLSETEDQRAGAPAARTSKRIRSRPLKGEDAEVKHVVQAHDISPAQRESWCAVTVTTGARSTRLRQSTRTTNEGPLDRAYAAS